MSLRQGPRSRYTFSASHMACSGTALVKLGADAAEGVGS